MKSFRMNFNMLAIVMAGLFASLSVVAQDLSRNRVPSVVINEFQKRFPKAVDVDWELDKGVYQVDFEVDRLDHEVWFDREGRILKQEEEVKVRSLPEAIRSHVRQHHRGYMIMDAEKLIRD